MKRASRRRQQRQQRLTTLSYSLHFFSRNFVRLFSISFQSGNGIPYTLSPQKPIWIFIYILRFEEQIVILSASISLCLSLSLSMVSIFPVRYMHTLQNGIDNKCQFQCGKTCCYFCTMFSCSPKKDRHMSTHPDTYVLWLLLLWRVCVCV